MFYRKHQSGFGLLEQLVTLLVFSVGVVGAIKLQATAINQASDAQYRSETSLLANQIIEIMRTDSAALRTYQHNPGGGLTCVPTVTASSNANVVAWLNSFTTTNSPTYLPSATSTSQQISVDFTNIVQVTVCWKPPHDDGCHNLTLSSQIQV